MDATRHQQTGVHKKVHVFKNNELSGDEAIGHGGFGHVVHRVWDRYQIDVAEKQLVQYSTDREQTDLKQEADLLAKIQHEHVVKLYGIRFTDGRNFCLVMEYMKYGSCTTFFEENRFKKDTMPLKHRIAVQVAKTMSFLHGIFPKRILHLDLKSANVLLDNKLNVKICDFGLSVLRTVSRIAQQSAGTSKGIGGTVTHLAPEHLESSKCKPSTKSDVYSFGIFVWELMSETPPYKHALNSSTLMQQVINGERPDLNKIPQNCPHQIHDCMIESWDKEKGKRPEFAEIWERITPIPFDNIDRLVTELLLSLNVRYSQLTATHSSMPTNVNRRDGVRWPEPNCRSEGICASSFSLEDSEVQTHVKQPLSPQATIFPDGRINSMDSGNESYGSSLPAGPSTSEDLPPVYVSDEAQLLSRVEASMPGEENSEHIGNKRYACRRTVIAGGILVLLVGLGVAGILLYLKYKSQGPCKVPSPLSTYDTITCKPPLPAQATQTHSGTVCSVTCQTGYGILNGSSQLACLSGTWNETEPTCSKLGICPILHNPANGGSVQCTNNFYETSVCTFSCPEDYHLRGGSGSTSSTKCDRDGTGGVTWDAAVPYCEKYSTCVPLGNPPTGKYDCSPTQGNTMYNNGTLCNLNCSPGYAVDGNNAVLCKGDGTWNNTKLFCQQTCQKIAVPTNGGVHCKHKNFIGSVCSFTCNTNFTMLGVLRTTCERNSKWTNKPVNCICPTCRGGSKCQFINTWKDAVALLNHTYDLTPPKTSFTTTYVGHKVVCTNPQAPGSPKSCICRDAESQKGRQCNKQGSQYENCRQSLSTLFSLMAFQGSYPLPCDANMMPPNC